MTPRAASLLRDLEAYAPSAEPSERPSLETMLAFVRSAPDPLSRESSPSHVTASAVILRPETGEFLLIHHRKLERWLQPGGHVDAEDAGTREAARREAREETGAPDLEDPLGPILDVDVHPIPPRGGLPGHIHHDVRYLFHSRAEALRGQEDEVHGVGWFSLAEAISRGIDASLERALRKALARAGKTENAKRRP